MHSAELIARVVGPIYLIAALGLFLDPDRYRRTVEDFLDNAALSYLAGFLALAFGLLILAFHSQWDASWRVVVTVIGWLATLKGAALLVRPNLFANTSRTMMAGPGRIRAMAVIAALLGAFLGLHGYALL